MANYEVEVPRLRDRDVFKFFRSVAETMNASSFTVTEIGGPSPTYSLAESGALDNAYLARSELFTVFSAHVSDDQGNSVRLERRSAEPFADKLTFSTNDNRRASDDVVRSLNRLTSDTFAHDSHNPASAFGSQSVVAQLVKSHQKMLTQLQSTATNMAEQLAAARLRLEEEFVERQTKLETEFQNRQTQSDTTMEEFRRSIINREEELQQRAQALDDRDHIHARRQLREQITKNIAERLKGAIVPLRTSAVGWTVFALALLGAGFLGALSYFSLTEFTEIVRAGAAANTAVQMKTDVAAVNLASSSAVWFLLIRGVLASLGAVAFLFYAISWLKSIYHSDVKAQRELERYAIDLNRASWAVETIMEAKASQGAIPDILVASLSRGLFDGPAERSNLDPSSEALSSLLRASAKAKIGPTGAEFELNSRGANKIANQLED